MGASKNKVFGFFDRPHPGLPPEREGAKPRRLKIVSNHVSFSLPLLHGKTRRGALVFDVADLVKDAYVMPAAFRSGASRTSARDFRAGLIEVCQKEEILDRLFGFVAELTQEITLKQ